jgi:hypothetical protein
MAAEVYGKITFIGNGIRIKNRRRPLNIRKENLQFVFVHADRDYDIRRTRPGTPKKVIIVRADSPRQTIRRAKVIDGAGFTVIGGKNRAMSPILRR